MMTRFPMFHVELLLVDLSLRVKHRSDFVQEDHGYFDFGNLKDNYYYYIYFGIVDEDLAGVLGLSILHSIVFTILLIIRGVKSRNFTDGCRLFKFDQD